MYIHARVYIYLSLSLCVCMHACMRACVCDITCANQKSFFDLGYVMNRPEAFIYDS